MIPGQGSMDAVVKRGGHPENLREMAFRLLAVRSRSVQELRDRLRKRGFDKGAIEKALLELQDRGYLDDRQFAEQRACYLTEVKGFGFLRVRGELRKKGIEEETISEVMKEIGIEGDELERAREVVKRYLKGEPLSDPAPDHQARISRYLKQRGFSWDVIGDLLMEGRFD